jgi:hypothetical protein
VAQAFGGLGQREAELPQRLRADPSPREDHARSRRGRPRRRRGNWKRDRSPASG